MNRRIILIVLALVVLIGGGIALSYYLSLHQVTVNIKHEGVGVEITRAGSGGAKVGSLSSSGTLRLPKGDYEVAATGQNFDSTPVPLTVAGKDVTIDIDPGYSLPYLDQLLTSERPAIAQLINTTYSSVISGFKVGQGRLYLYGDWYATTLTQPTTRTSNGDVYRLVLHKTGSQWTVAAAPDLVLSSKTYPNVPKSVLDDINHQNGY